MTGKTGVLKCPDHAKCKDRTSGSKCLCKRGFSVVLDGKNFKCESKFGLFITTML